ncbi:MAG: hypothetical protein OXE96_03090 [Gemmatimonadetes bacterium]|nr:hypothetical protein [Gemmatimonadota bacterium]
MRRRGVRAGAEAQARRRTVGGQMVADPITLTLATHLAARKNALPVDIHLFTFGGLADAAEWLSSLRTAKPGGR